MRRVALNEVFMYFQNYTVSVGNSFTSADNAIDIVERMLMHFEIERKYVRNVKFCITFYKDFFVKVSKTWSLTLNSKMDLKTAKIAIIKSIASH